MATYLLLNLVFFGLLALIVWSRPVSLTRRHLVVLAVVLLGLTALFDSLIIKAGIVAYDQAKLLGWYVGRAPLEDFAYCLAAAVLVPYLWKRLGGRHE